MSPIYEYDCENCGKSWEVIQKFSDEPLIDCAECGQKTLIKKMSKNSFQLKGKGWTGKFNKKVEKVKE